MILPFRKGLLFTAAATALHSANAEESTKRIVAYVPSWSDCPTINQIQKYTHIMIGFATSLQSDSSCSCSKGQCQNDSCFHGCYQSSSTNTNTCKSCSDDCTLKVGSSGTPNNPVLCSGQDNYPKDGYPTLVEYWQSKGKKVILSFGGASMGGDWRDDPNGCWDSCVANEDHVVNQLVEIVSDQGFDGVDINYEYFLNTAERQNFLKNLTKRLRVELPDSIISHAPKNSATKEGADYIEKVLKDVVADVDFIKPQYFWNELGIYDLSDSGALDHYTYLVNDVFDGAAEKVVFGFCADDGLGQAQDGKCVNGARAAQIMGDLNFYHPCNGGAGFWKSTRDLDGAWSAAVSAVVDMSNEICSDPSTLPPTPTPTLPPTSPPLDPSTLPPTPTPTLPPTSPPSPPTGTGYCNYGDDGTGDTSTCEGGPEGGLWCNENSDHCENCGGRWCSNNPSTSTPAPTPQPVPSSGYCNYGPNGDAASSTCEGGPEGGVWCNQSSAHCANCSGRWCTDGA